jgi:hypothetical protein
VGKSVLGIWRREADSLMQITDKLNDEGHARGIPS